MTTPTRPWLPMMALLLSAAGALPASSDAQKKAEASHGAKPQAKPAPKQEAQPAPKQDAKAAAPAPAQAAAPVPKAVPAPRPAVRPASIRPIPRRRGAMPRRAAAPVTVTASPPASEPVAQPSTAVIHLVTHAAGDSGTAGFPVPPGVASLLEEREREEKARQEWERAGRERREKEQALEERERNLAAREAAARSPAAEAPAERPARKRIDRNLLSNEGLVRLAEAGYDEVFLMDLIRRKAARFDTSVEGLEYLMKAGLSQQLVRSVLAVEEWERARRNEELAAAQAGTPERAPADLPADMKPVRQELMVPGGQLRAGERGRMMLAPSGERWYWVPDAGAAQ